MFKVKTYNKIAEEGLAILRKARFEISETTDKPDAIILRSHNLHNDFIPDTVKAIGRAGAGTNNIPVDECTKRGIIVFNTPGANANAVKELVIGGMINVSRNLFSALTYVKGLTQTGDELENIVEKSKARFKGYELAGKQLGVIGLGAIGMMVANDCTVLGMDVEGYDPFLSVNRAWELSRSVRPAASLNRMLSKSDFITVHMPLTEQTRDFINKEKLKFFKKGSVLLNFARAEIVNEKDIIEALKSGQLAAYITDFPTENLIKLDNAICYPHLGASTEEAELNCAIMIARQIHDFLENGNISNSVNFPSCSSERMGNYRITFANQNVPNIVSQITTILGQDDLNIMELINKSQGDIAYNIIDLDNKPSDEALNKIKSIEGILFIRSIH